MCSGRARPSAFCLVAAGLRLKPEPLRGVIVCAQATMGKEKSAVGKKARASSKKDVPRQKRGRELSASSLEEDPAPKRVNTSKQGGQDHAAAGNQAQRTEAVEDEGETAMELVRAAKR